jgi:transcriptional regulator NrdR family protein
MPIPPEERLTARQLQAQTNGTDPWACPKCGCKATEVIDSRRRDGDPARRRLRACLHCHHPRETEEHIVPQGFKVVVVPEDEERAAA